MKIIKLIFFNSWIKSLFFICMCFVFTYFIIYHSLDVLKGFINFRDKNFWISLGVVIPTMFLLPTFINMFLFAKIVQIADNTNKTQKLLVEQIKILKELLKQK